MRGEYHAAQRLFEVTAQDSAPDDIRDLAETMGMMSVKIEAREMALEEKLAEIEEKNRALEQAARLRAESGFALCSIIVTLSAYFFFIKVGMTLGWIEPHTTWLYAVGLMVFMLFSIYFYSRKHRRPLSSWGLTWRGAGRSAWESLLVCLPAVVLLAGLKVWLVRQSWSPFYGQPVFNWDFPWWPLALYALGVVVQEFLARGFAQETVMRLLDGKHRVWWAIVLPSALFSIVHLQYTVSIVAGTFMAGILFGWLYHRQRTLVGVSIAHFILSVTAWEILGLIG